MRGNGQDEFKVHLGQSFSLVIPAKAGIKFIEKHLRSRKTSGFCPLRGLFFLLDFRLRGNDGANGKSWFITMPSAS
jgi:hypothetical protein